MNRRYCGVLLAVLTAITIAFLMQGSAYAAKVCPKCKKHFADKYAFCDREGSKLSPIKVSATKPKRKSQPTFNPRARNKARANVIPKIEMIYVPAGLFKMGSSDCDETSNEYPEHSVYLSAYWIGKYEVTVAQYRAFCKTTGRKMPWAPVWGWKDNHAIVNVTWKDADAFAKWAGGHLPTEAQWEKAARGELGSEYPWGDTWDKNLCINENLQGTKVGLFPKGKSPYGCHDMAGNVREWCNDWYADNYYSQSPTSDPKGPSSGKYRVLRGGCFYNNGYIDLNRCAYRDKYNPYGYDPLSGFRLAR